MQKILQSPNIAEVEVDVLMRNGVMLEDLNGLSDASGIGCHVLMVAMS